MRMTKEHFHVRPNDSGAGWSVDHYDGRGAWAGTSHISESKETLSTYTGLSVQLEAAQRDFLCAWQDALDLGAAGAAKVFQSASEAMFRAGEMLKLAAATRRSAGATFRVAAEQYQPLTKAEDGAGKSKAPEGKFSEPPGECGALREVVALVEWSGSDLRLECPLCHGTKEKGHLAECLIAQALPGGTCQRQASCPRCQQVTTPDVNGGHYCSFCQAPA